MESSTVVVINYGMRKVQYKHNLSVGYNTHFTLKIAVAFEAWLAMEIMPALFVCTFDIGISICCL